MGKLEGGNFSLLLTEGEYKMLIVYKPAPQGADINKYIAETLRQSGAAPFASIADPQRKQFLTSMIDHWRKL